MSSIENWYLALELPFDPVPESDQAAISARITEKVAFWSAKANDPAKGSLYTRWRESADRMRSDLADPATREKLAAEARDLTYGKLDDALKQMSGNGTRTISPKDLARVAGMRGFTVDVALRRAKAINVEVAEGESTDPAEFQRTFDAFMARPDRHLQFDGFRADLGTVGARDLYAFLEHASGEVGLTIEPGQASTLPTATLFETGKKLRIKYFRVTTAREKATSIVGKYCETAFADEDSRRAYDAYLAFGERRELVDSIAQEIEHIWSRRCSRDQAEQYILTLAPHVGGKEKAGELFVALCEVKGFSYDVSEEASGLASKEVCRCGAINDVSIGARSCTRCGRPLRQVCPRCGTESPNAYSFCPCGFDFLNVLRAGSACALARSALAAFDITAAKEHVAVARSLYAAHPDLAGVEQELSRLDRAIGSQVSAIEREVAAQNLHRANGLLATLMTAHPTYANDALKEQVDRGLARANALLTSARSAASADRAMAALVEANSICRDLPGLVELWARHSDLPIEAHAVAGVKAEDVSVAHVNQRVVVRMRAPGQGESAILVAYRFDAFPTGPTDPEAIVREFQAVELANEGVLRLEPAQKRRYHVAVYLKFRTAGREYLTQGAFATLDLASEVVLTYALVRRLFSRKLTLEITSDQPVDRIPEIAMAWNAGHAPVFEASAKHLVTIPAQAVQLPFSHAVDLPALPKNAYVKPFLHDDSGTFKLKLATNSSNKVS